MGGSSFCLPRYRTFQPQTTSPDVLVEFCFMAVCYMLIYKQSCGLETSAMADPPKKPKTLLEKEGKGTVPKLPELHCYRKLNNSDSYRENRCAQC